MATNAQKLGLYTRALKNCNFVSAFWIGYMLESEKRVPTYSEIEGIC